MTKCYIVKGRSVDGTIYADVLCNSWVYNAREATLLTRDAAEQVAQNLEEREVKTRNPDNGVYQICAIEYTPTPYDMDDLVEIAHEEALTEHYYRDNP